MGGQHAVLSASKAGRWARCVGSLFACKGVPNVTTIYAASGTCTHWLGEQLLRDAVAPETYIGKTLEFDGFKFVVDSDRCARVHKYVNTIRTEPGTVMVEQKLNTSRVLGVPGQYGRSDCITAAPDLGIVRKENEEGEADPNGKDVHYRGIVSVHDLKDGRGHAVEAENLLQGLVYCAAALDLLDLEGHYEGVRFCIHQPILDHYSETFYSRRQIVQFISLIQPLAQLAWGLYNGTIPFDPDVHLNPGPEQCMFCEINGNCKRRTAHVLKMFKPNVKAFDLSNEDLGEIYVTLDQLKSWIKDMEQEGDKRVLAGNHVPGLKAVRGKPGNRQWPDVPKAKTALVAAFGALAFQPAEIVSPTEAERLAKLADVDLETIAPLWSRSEARIIVVPDTDKRPAVAVSRPEFEPVKAG